jgi:hypothetical protein
MKTNVANRLYFDYNIDNQNLFLQIDFANIDELNKHLCTVKLFNSNIKIFEKSDNFKADKILTDFYKYLKTNKIEKKLFVIS